MALYSALPVVLFFASKASAGCDGPCPPFTKQVIPNHLQITCATPSPGGVYVDGKMMAFDSAEIATAWIPNWGQVNVKGKAYHIPIVRNCINPNNGPCTLPGCMPMDDYVPKHPETMPLTGTWGGAIKVTGEQIPPGSKLICMDISPYTIFRYAYGAIKGYPSMAILNSYPHPSTATYKVTNCASVGILNTNIALGMNPCAGVPNCLVDFYDARVDPTDIEFPAGSLTRDNVAVTPNGLSIPFGSSVQCTEQNNGKVYRYSYGQLRHYPNLAIANSYDSQWFAKIYYVNCASSKLVVGLPLPQNTYTKVDMWLAVPFESFSNVIPIIKGIKIASRLNLGGLKRTLNESDSSERLWKRAFATVSGTGLVYTAPIGDMRQADNPCYENVFNKADYVLAAQCGVNLQLYYSGNADATQKAYNTVLQYTVYNSVIKQCAYWNREVPRKALTSDISCLNAINAITDRSQQNFANVLASTFATI